MIVIRTFRLDDGCCVVAVSGELEQSDAAEVDAEIARRLAEGCVVVDLLDVYWADTTTLHAARAESVTVVAEPRILDRLGLTDGVRVAPTLASALVRTA